MKKVNFVFIAGLYHSGSTLLDLILGQHPRIVGLGEVDRVLTLGPEPMCSCGQLSEQCPFWSRVIPSLNAQHSDDLQARMKIVLNSFQDHFGEDKILLDSSKHLETLQLLQRTEGISIKVIHLIRDVRSWTLALLDRERKARERMCSTSPSDCPSFFNGWKPNIRSVTRSAPVRFIQWHRTNKRIQQFLKSNDIPTLLIGYEELVFYTQDIVSKIWDFLGVENSGQIKSLSTSSSHIVRGNRMRNQEEKRQTVVYDNRWLYRDEWLLPSLFFRHIMRYNSQEVYSNLRYTSEGIDRHK